MGFFDDIVDDMGGNKDNKEENRYKPEIEDAGVKRLPTVMCPSCNKPMSVKRKRKEEEESSGLLGGKKTVTYVDFECNDCGSNWTEKVDEEKQSKCFIATATLGSPTHPKLDILRDFRDKKMLNYSVGKSLVELYYKLSPPFASLISKSNKLRKISRKLIINPIIKIVEN